MIQTDWNPESEHGGLYQLVGSDYSVDAGSKTVSGPSSRTATDTGVKLEIRSGGPAIGFQPVTSQMYTDDAITLGYVGTDEAIQTRPTSRRPRSFAPLENNPQMIMWDPATYPDVKASPTSARRTSTVRYFDGAAYMELPDGAGILKETRSTAATTARPGQLRRRRRQGRPAGLRHRRAVHLRERGRRLGQAVDTS